MRDSAQEPNSPRHSGVSVAMPAVPPQEAEANLLQRAIHGDRQAFGELLQRHQPRALALATELVGSREDARDLLQEAALKAWRALHGFVPGRPFFPWFYRILRNACIQHLRARKLRRSRSLTVDADGETVVLEPSDRAAPLPEELFEQGERSRRLAQALVRLPPADAEILMLRHFQDLSYQEIAEALSIPVGTVMSRLHTARRRLRQLLPEMAAA
ncbi:MAG: sigma-70 family RNA polymerase sigma factor [Planctomycetota bacterium]|nr:MAG: sigma-70 family RNA polymerase sigma factor [Planctomycetota bacterium]